MIWRSSSAHEYSWISIDGVNRVKTRRSEYSKWGKSYNRNEYLRRGMQFRVHLRVGPAADNGLGAQKLDAAPGGWHGRFVQQVGNKHFQRNARGGLLRRQVQLPQILLHASHRRDLWACVQREEKRKKKEEEEEKKKKKKKEGEGVGGGL